MYKVSIPVLELALKNQENYRLEVQMFMKTTFTPTSTIYKRELNRVEKSIAQLKDILGK